METLADLNAAENTIERILLLACGVALGLGVLAAWCTLLACIALARGCIASGEGYWLAVLLALFFGRSPSLVAFLALI